jgi:hypothetical protein
MPLRRWIPCSSRAAQEVPRPGRLRPCRIWLFGRGGNMWRTLAAGHAEIKSYYLDCGMGQMGAQMDAPRPWPLVPGRNR